MRFEWDPGKDQLNQKKHGFSFVEAKELLGGDEDCLEIYDELHSGEEDRFIAIGPTTAGIIVVVYTERQDDVIRIVSARTATASEVRLFHKYLGGTYA